MLRMLTRRSFRHDHACIWQATRWCAAERRAETLACRTASLVDNLNIVEDLVLAAV